MNFERLALQQRVERMLHCSDVADWRAKKPALEALQLTREDVSNLVPDIDRDASSFLQRSLISFAGGYQDVVSGNRGWGIVKLYYALFYALRSRLFARRHVMVRNDCWFYANVNGSSSSDVVSIKRLAGKRFRNDHETALNLYEDIFGGSDVLISNSVSGESPFAWLMNLRNLANYKMARFTDPAFPHDVFESTIVEDRDVDALITENLADETHILLFQPEHAWIALPMKQLIAAVEDVRAINGSAQVSESEHRRAQTVRDGLPAKVAEALGEIDFLRVGNRDSDAGR